ncbi:MAG: metal ABC transporter permease [Sporichthyaceae bacterium]
MLGPFTELLLDPYSSQFMRRALLAAILVGVLCPVVGVWVILRRLAFLGDAMAHSTLSGVAAAYLLGVSIVAGALVAGLLMGLLVALLGARRALHDDAAIGVVETVLFATGLILIASNDDIGVDLGHLLLGQITTVDHHDLVLAGVLVAIVLSAAALLGRDLLSATFDPVHARGVGVPEAAVRVVVLAMVCIAVVVSLQTVGLLMSVAILVTPAASARLWTCRVGTMTAAAVGYGLFATVGGLTVSYHAASPPGATIALVAAACFAATFLLTLPVHTARRGHPDSFAGERDQPLKAGQSLQ